MKKHTQISPVMRRLSTYVAGAVGRKLPAAVIERAKLCLIDHFASTISGSRLIGGELGIKYVKRAGGPAEAGVVGTRIVTSALNAAFANGMSCHADESDDTHPPTCTHPNTGVVPAALAIAERDRLSGESFLRAMVLGFDVCARIVLSIKTLTFFRTGHHTGSHGQLFGAGAATAALLRLDAQKVRYMFSYCAEQAAGLFTMLRDSHHIEKAYAMGAMPAHNGVAAALMVAQGFYGVDDVFSGRPNYLQIFSSGADTTDPTELVRGLGREYEIMRGGIKRWPVGAPVQGPLHVLHDLMQQHGFGADDVERIVARIPDKELAMVDNRDMADISLQHLLAIMLVDGTVTVEAAHDYARMKNRTLLALRRRIETVGDPKLTDPLRRWRCVMEVRLKDGRNLAHQTLAAKGTFENPLTRGEVEEKAHDLMGPVIGRKRSDALIAQLYRIERIKDMRALRPLYAA